MFGDSMFDEEERLRRSEDGLDEEPNSSEESTEDVMAAGGLDERIRRREAVAQLLREVGGC